MGGPGSGRKPEGRKRVKLPSSRGRGAAKAVGHSEAKGFSGNKYKKVGQNVVLTEAFKRHQSAYLKERAQSPGSPQKTIRIGNSFFDVSGGKLKKKGR